MSFLQEHFSNRPQTSLLSFHCVQRFPRMTKVELWYEFASTYSYLAVLRAPMEATARGITLVLKPFLLGPIFREQGFDDSPFNLYPRKGQYMWRDLERRAARFDLEFQRPSAFPRNGLQAARIALVAEDEGWGLDWAHAAFRANFVLDLDIAAVGVVGDLLAGLGQDPKRVLAAASSTEIKLRLREQTDCARELGIFGAPAFVANQELFWGDDRLDDAFDWAVDNS